MKHHKQGANTCKSNNWKVSSEMIVQLKQKKETCNNYAYIRYTWRHLINSVYIPEIIMCSLWNPNILVSDANDQSKTFIGRIWATRWKHLKSSINSRMSLCTYFEIPGRIVPWHGVPWKISLRAVKSVSSCFRIIKVPSFIETHFLRYTLSTATCSNLSH